MRGWRDLGKDREELCAVTLLRCLAKKEPLYWGIPFALPSWSTDEVPVLFIPCSLHFGVQSYSHLWPDGLASPLILPGQTAFCSLPPLLLSCNCWAHGWSWPSSTVQLPFLIYLPLPLPILFPCFSCLSLFYCPLLLPNTFRCLSNKGDFVDISVMEWMTSLAHTTWSQ